MSYRCCRCNGEYLQDDDRTFTENIPSPDPDWNPSDNYCYGCHLMLMYDIFGGYLEPVFHLNGIMAFADGIYDPSTRTTEPGDDDNLPF